MISNVDSISDSGSSGAVDPNSVITISLNTVRDTSARGEFDIVVKLSLAKYVLFGYVTVPDVFTDRLWKAFARPPNFIYQGNR